MWRAFLFLVFATLAVCARGAAPPQLSPHVVGVPQANGTLVSAQSQLVFVRPSTHHSQMADIAAVPGSAPYAPDAGAPGFVGTCDGDMPLLLLGALDDGGARVLLELTCAPDPVVAAAHPVGPLRAACNMSAGAVPVGTVNATHVVLAESDRVCAAALDGTGAYAAQVPSAATFQTALRGAGPLLTACRFPEETVVWTCAWGTLACTAVRAWAGCTDQVVTDGTHLVALVQGPDGAELLHGAVSAAAPPPERVALLQGAAVGGLQAADNVVSLAQLGAPMVVVDLATGQVVMVPVEGRVWLASATPGLTVLDVGRGGVRARTLPMCPLGHTYNLDASTCEACPRGTFGDTTWGVALCLPCPAGTAGNAPLHGPDACVPCEDPLLCSAGTAVDPFAGADLFVNRTETWPPVSNIPELDLESSMTVFIFPFLLLGAIVAGAGSFLCYRFGWPETKPGRLFSVLDITQRMHHRSAFGAFLSLMAFAGAAGLVYFSVFVDNSELNRRDVVSLDMLLHEDLQLNADAAVAKPVKLRTCFLGVSNTSALDVGVSGVGHTFVDILPGPGNGTWCVSSQVTDGLGDPLPAEVGLSAAGLHVGSVLHQVQFGESEVPGDGFWRQRVVSTWMGADAPSQMAVEGNTFTNGTVFLDMRWIPVLFQNCSQVMFGNIFVANGTIAQQCDVDARQSHAEAFVYEHRVAVSNSASMIMPPEVPMVEVRYTFRRGGAERMAVNVSRQVQFGFYAVLILSVLLFFSVMEILTKGGEIMVSMFSGRICSRAAQHPIDCPEGVFVRKRPKTLDDKNHAHGGLDILPIHLPQ